MFFRSGTDYNMIVEAVGQAIKPIAQALQKVESKVDLLSSDHVRREDLDKLRQEVKTGFENIGQEYLRRDIYDQQQKQLQRDIEDLKAYRAEQQQQQKTWLLRTGQGISILIAIIVGVISVILFLIQHVDLR